MEGQRYTLTCIVSGGNPAPSVRWLRDNQVIDEVLESSTGNTYVNEYTFTATNNEHLEVFECQSENGVLQNPLSTTKFVLVLYKFYVVILIRGHPYWPETKLASNKAD